MLNNLSVRSSVYVLGGSMAANSGKQLLYTYSKKQRRVIKCFFYKGHKNTAMKKERKPCAAVVVTTHLRCRQS